MDVKVVMFKRDGHRKDFRIHQPSTIVGRGEECSLRIPLLNVSRHHCELIKSDKELKVRDLGSANGTYVNNRRITEVALKAGDRLVVGPVVFTVQVDGQPQQISPVKTKAQKAAGTTGDKAPAADEVVELEADVAGGQADDVDPIAALEALARQTSASRKKK